jgi:hypothetical protein
MESNQPAPSNDPATQTAVIPEPQTVILFDAKDPYETKSLDVEKSEQRDK